MSATACAVSGSGSSICASSAAASGSREIPIRRDGSFALRVPLSYCFKYLAKLERSESVPLNFSPEAVDFKNFKGFIGDSRFLKVWQASYQSPRTLSIASLERLVPGLGPRFFGIGDLLGLGTIVNVHGGVAVTTHTTAFEPSRCGIELQRVEVLVAAVLVSIDSQILFDVRIVAPITPGARWRIETVNNYIQKALSTSSVLKNESRKKQRAF